MPPENYTKPKVYHNDFDVNKTWFVAFRYTDLASGMTRQFQYRGDINKQKTKRDKIAEANALRDVLYQMLLDGFNPFTGITRKQSNFSGTLIDTVDQLNEMRENTIKRESTRTYKDVAKVFNEWLKSQGISKITPTQFSNQLARKYLDYCLGLGYNSSTHNKHLSMLITLFNLMLDREYVKLNPFKGIKPLRRDIGKNIAFTINERRDLSEAIAAENKPLSLFIQFMFYCFLRRTEILCLRIKDIDIENRSILVAFGSSKSRKQENVTIPSAFIDVLKSYNLNEHDGNFYVFSKLMLPGPTIRKKADSISDKHRVYLRRLNISNEKTIYSWKHTGVIELYNEIKDPYAVMRQLRHHDLQTTMFYLKSLGLSSNKPVWESKMQM